MVFSKLLEAEVGQTDPEERKKELEELEFQVYRMRENMKEISQKYDVIGIDQTKYSNWVIVFKEDDGNICRVMLDDCQSPFRGSWDFCIQAEYTDHNNIHIADIKGPGRSRIRFCVNEIFKRYCDKAEYPGDQG